MYFKSTQIFTKKIIFRKDLQIYVYQKDLKSLQFFIYKAYEQRGNFSPKIFIEKKI